MSSESDLTPKFQGNTYIMIKLFSPRSSSSSDSQDPQTLVLIAPVSGVGLDFGDRYSKRVGRSRIEKVRYELVGNNSAWTHDNSV